MVRRHKTQSIWKRGTIWSINFSTTKWSARTPSPITVNPEIKMTSRICRQRRIRVRDCRRCRCRVKAVIDQVRSKYLKVYMLMQQRPLRAKNPKVRQKVASSAKKNRSLSTSLARTTNQRINLIRVCWITLKTSQTPSWQLATPGATMTCPFSVRGRPLVLKCRSKTTSRSGTCGKPANCPVETGRNLCSARRAASGSWRMVRWLCRSPRKSAFPVS